jgi:hypothetical protein
VVRLRDKDEGGRGVTRGDGYLRRLPDTRKSLKQWLSEPGAGLALALLCGFFFLVWVCCMFTGTVLAGFLVERSPLVTFLMGNALFGMVLGGWALLGGSRRLLLTDGGVMDRIIGIFGHTAKPLEFDDAPARLARKRGNPDEALRLYRVAVRELPHRLDLHYRIAEVEHVDKGLIDEGTRGYRMFLRRLEAAEREPTVVEGECEVLARTRLADLERASGEPPPRREIKI